MKNDKMHIARMLLVAAITITFTSAYAFELLNPPRKWFQGVSDGPNDLPVEFLVNEDGEESVADGDNGVTAVLEAIQRWEDEMENSLDLLFTGTTSLNVVARDGMNITSFNDPARIVRGALAISIVGWYDSGQSETVNGISFGRYLESDVSFSKRKKFTTSAIGSCSGSYDIQAIQAQEIGHSLGLGHSANGAAIMFGSIGKCVFKTMHSDDHNGINTIYNPGFSGGGGCTAIEALLVGHSCAAPRRGRNCLTITIDVNDDCGNAVAGASVTVQLVGVEVEQVLTGTANTDSSGSITFALRCKDAKSTNYISTVLSINGNLPWDPNDPDNSASVEIGCQAR